MINKKFKIHYNDSYYHPNSLGKWAKILTNDIIQCYESSNYYTWLTYLKSDGYIGRIANTYKDINYD